MLSVALAGSPAAAGKAAAALDRYGPHVARYAKLEGGQPGAVVLEVTYHAADTVSLRAQAAEVDATFAIDAVHARVRVADQCAVVAMAPLLRTVEDAGTAPAAQDGISAQLDYRLTATGQADLDIVFQRTDLPASLGWLVGMADEDAAVSRDGRSWRVEQDGVTWWVSRKTGMLERMTAGEHTLVQTSAAPIGPDTIPEARRCPQSSDGLTNAMFTAQFLWEAYSRSLPDAFSDWQAQPPFARDATIQQQRSFWRHYFVAQMQSWEASLQQDPIWRAQVIAGMGDVHAYEMFAAQLPPARQPAAMRAWQEAWFANAGRALLSDQVAATEQMIRQTLDDSAASELDLVATHVVQPMTQEALSAGEAVLIPLLGPVVEQGAAQLAFKLER